MIPVLVIRSIPTTFLQKIVTVRVVNELARFIISKKKRNPRKGNRRRKKNVISNLL